MRVVFVRLLSIVLFFQCLMASSALAQPAEPMTLTVQNQRDYARLILDFTSRIELPAYEVNSENGVLTVQFDDPISTVLPDVSAILANYIAVARTDPDARGVRFGLKGEFRVNTIEAGEKLFIDILPADWTGVLPGLPSDVVAELTRRAKEAAVEAERRRKAEVAANMRPSVELRVGRHPAFTRLRFEWTMDVKAKFEQSGAESVLTFEWPVPIDLFSLKADLPAELLDVTNSLSRDGSRLQFTSAGGVTPRFYSESSKSYVIDIDVLNPPEQGLDIASLLPETVSLAREEEASADAVAATDTNVGPANEQRVVTPRVETVGSTVRVVFPFENDTPAAVFRRGDMVWMVFDTLASIERPEDDGSFGALADDFDSVAIGGTSIVRMRLLSDRLASMGSEGKAWVLSLGDILLTSAEPLKLDRRQNSEGLFEVTANLIDPARVHQLRDPDVGDVLEVVTAFPPARGVVRTLEYVDFTALRSVHGMVVKPQHDELRVAIAEGKAVISSERGLILSPARNSSGDDATSDPTQRDGYVDLVTLAEPDPVRLNEQTREFEQLLATVDPAEQDQIRIDLARHYLSNELFYEAAGTLRFAQDALKKKELGRSVRLMRAVAELGAGRPELAIPNLSADEMAGSADALVWRAIALSDAARYEAARADALVAESVVPSYPLWAQNRFYMAGALAALETGDAGSASRMLSRVDTAGMSAESLTLYEIYSGRLDEAEGRLDEALDTYGAVIAADIRPTRAEAIYRTLKLLQVMDRLDPDRGAETLALEAAVWRGDALEAKMLTLLGELFFRSGNYREAFETIQAAAKSHPNEPAVDQMLEQARLVFADLYLNGQADSMEPVEALTLYYDFRQLTPPGARGDEMIRNLARRLIKVDLLTQAAELLEYQVAERLEGAAKAQVAADLAIIQIADRKPEQALAALNISRVNELPPALERQRRILEARALVDAGREDLALDLLSVMDGRDADLLRVDAHWRGKRYQDAAELLERLYAPSRQDDELSVIARESIVKAAVGFVLAGDQIGLTRLRSKFSERIVTTPQWPVFNFVTGAVRSSSLEFKAVAREVASVDSLNAFLKSYRETYEADGAIAPDEVNTSPQG